MLSSVQNVTVFEENPDFAIALKRLLSNFHVKDTKSDVTIAALTFLRSLLAKSSKLRWIFREKVTLLMTLADLLNPSVTEDSNLDKVILILDILRHMTLNAQLKMVDAFVATLLPKLLM